MLSSQANLMGPGHPKVVKKRAEAILELKRHMSTTHISPSESAQLCDELAVDQPLFTAEARLELGEPLSVVTPLASGGVSQDGHDQQHFYLHEYLTEELWAFQLNPSNHIDEKLDALRQFPQEVVGLVSPCQSTSAYAASISIKASKVSLSRKQVLEKVVKFKTIMKQLHFGYACRLPSRRRDFDSAVSCTI